MTEKEKAKAYDKKIREAILNGLIDCRDAPDLGWSNFGGIHIDDCIAWLEKQGEQASSQTNERAWLYLVSDILTWKDGIGQYLDDPRVQELAKKLCSEYAQKLYNPSVLSDTSNTGNNEQQSYDKIESKFHKGDWITIDKPCQIINIHDNGNYIVQYCDDEKTHELSKNFCESYFHFWTIQDAKDGDVLALSWLEDKNLWEKIIIFKKYHSKGVKGLPSMPCVEGYGNTFMNGKMAFAEKAPYHSKTWTCNLHPATKEQRDLLFQKIKEAGYKWNTETKTLEKLVEPKFKVGDKIVNVPMKYMGGSWTQGTISKITDDKYIFTDGSYISISSQDSWELVHDKKSKFDPKTLQPYDKVLIRRGNENYNVWFPDFVADPPNNDNNKTLCMCVGEDIAMVIPYNNDTKYLIGTTDKAPDYYRYWED